MSIDGDRNLLSISSANAIFQAWLAKGMVIYGKIECGPQFNERVWLRPLSENNIPIGTTHTGILVCVEPIEKLVSLVELENAIALRTFDDWQAEGMHLRTLLKRILDNGLETKPNGAAHE